MGKEVFLNNIVFIILIRINLSFIKNKTKFVKTFEFKNENYGNFRKNNNWRICSSGF